MSPGIFTYVVQVSISMKEKPRNLINCACGLGNYIKPWAYKENELLEITFHIFSIKNQREILIIHV